MEVDACRKSLPKMEVGGNSDAELNQESRNMMGEVDYLDSVLKSLQMALKMLETEACVQDRQESCHMYGEAIRKTMELRDVAKKRAAARKKNAAMKMKALQGKGAKMSAAEKMKRDLQMYEEWKKRKEEEKCAPDSEEVTDPYAFEARSFKQRWNEMYDKMSYGRFDDNTSIPWKRFTFNPSPCGGRKRETLQVFSVKVAKLTGDLQWPLDLFGIVAVRDSLDHNRNIIFERKRDNCQVVTDENPYLALTGPVRAVVFCDSVIFEVSLYVKGIDEADDKELSLVATSFRRGSCPSVSLLIMQSYTSRLSTLDFKLGHIVSSVEATISVKVISGPPDGFHAEFVASTGSIEDDVLLHNSKDDKVCISGDDINLSRRVVSVESLGKLTVSVRASDGYVTLTGREDFKPLEEGISTRDIFIHGLCQFEVTVAWSLFSMFLK